MTHVDARRRASTSVAAVVAALLGAYVKLELYTMIHNLLDPLKLRSNNNFITFSRCLQFLQYTQGIATATAISIASSSDILMT